jgi:hypothetical protein
VLIRAATWLLLVIATSVPTTGLVFAASVPLRSDTPPATTVPTPPPDTVNDFLPVDRDIGDCISALPKPGCGSESRGGWAQTAVLGSIVLGISFIVWRIVVASRRAKRQQQGASS